MTNSDLAAAVEAALGVLPTSKGGAAIVLATSSTPPALAVLSSGDVYLSGDRIRVGIHATSSAATRLGDGFSLLIPMGRWAARVEATDASVAVVDQLAMLSGVVASIRPTTEAPWVLDMSFRPQQAEHESIPDFVEYWQQVRAWLSGRVDTPPRLPAR